MNLGLSPLTSKMGVILKHLKVLLKGFGGQQDNTLQPLEDTVFLRSSHPPHLALASFCSIETKGHKFGPVMGAWETEE